MPSLPPRGEFIALMAMLFATIAFSIDAMLPALPDIAADLSPGDINAAQLVVASFVLGMGIGTFFTGALSDALGRKPVILGGAALYAGAAVWATQVDSLEGLLAARALQGLGAAGPRVVALAIIRDLFSGRQMAQIVSIVLMVFALIPAIAPSVGALLMGLGGWHAIFWSFVAFAGVVSAWLTLRLPETLAPVHRRPLAVRPLLAAAREVVRLPVVRLAVLGQGLSLGMLFCMISNVQPVYDLVFDRADGFPLWFAGVAVVAASGSLLNARLVIRLGMRRLIAAMLSVQLGLTGVMLALLLAGLSGDALFFVFVVWQASIFFQAALTIGNFSAIALEPLGHVAGMAASVTTALATVMSVALAAPVSLAFDGTPLPLVGGTLLYVLLAGMVVVRMRRIEAAATA